MKNNFCYLLGVPLYLFLPTNKFDDDSYEVKLQIKCNFDHMHIINPDEA